MKKLYETNLSLVQKFSLLSLISLLGIGLISGSVISKSIEANIVHRTEKQISSIVQAHASMVLSPAIFDDPDYSKHNDVFLTYYRMIKSPEIDRIKIYNGEGTIIYSDEKELLGKNFRDNTDLAEALTGETLTGIDRRLMKEEQLFERGFGGLLELYIPIDFGTGNVVGVVEVYQSLAHLDADISRAKRDLWLSLFAGFLILYVVLFGIMKWASDTIHRQNLQLREYSTDLEQKIGERTEELSDTNARLEEEIDERKRAEDALRKRTHDFGERVKELNGLYGTSQLIVEPDNTLDDVFQGTVDLIPPSWHYPEITCARITFKDKQFKTSNWKKSKWTQSTDIATKKGKVGVIEVAYLKQKPKLYKGPFLKEERNLLDGLARILGDFIERKNAEEEVKKYTSEIEEANRLKDLFTDIMRHDLLNPAGIIKNIAELGLQENPGDEESELILESALRIQDTIETASKLSKMDILKDLEMEETDLKEIIDEECDHCNPIIQKAGMELENKISEGLPIRANPLIREVFLNLFTNAAKYASEGKKVIVEAELTGENYKITVKDFGEGIPDELKERIFDRFKRRDKVGVKGTGLGLAIVKRLVELHNGNVWVEDNPEGGSMFVVELPKNEGVDDG